jgi:phenylalanyl-tRNA synthetase beta chain
MDISLAWLNSYLEPADCSAQEADDLLTQAGLPIESHTPLPSGDVLLDVEVTSNRPDCLSHIGCAREVAALSGRTLKYPEPGAVPAAGEVGSWLTLENREPGACPLFTARVLTGCKVGLSPSWLVERLEAIGQRSINNAVDVTNFITHEFGNPCHVFDRSKLAGHALVVRFAEDGEKLRTLDEKQRVLKATDLVVADAERAQSLAGVIGGGDSEVSEETTEIVFEMATWDPVTVRTQARRLAITTDAGYRFQRGIDPRTLEQAAERAAALLAELTGGTLAGGVLREGAPLPEAQYVTLRPSRVARILGIEIPAGDIIAMLRGIEIGVDQSGEDELKCEIPAHRSRDLTREIDLIEEVARIKGYDAVPTDAKLSVAVRAPQAGRLAVRELGRVLTGMGFDETVTFSFANPKKAALLMPEGLEAAAVDEARRPDEPTLRPSALTGLLACRQANQAARSAAPGAVRLFEISAAFAQKPGTGGAGLPPESVETRNLSLLMDVPGSPETVKRKFEDRQTGLRVMRGVIDAAVRAMHGTEAVVEIEPCERVPSAAWDASATGVIRVRPSGGGEAIMLGLFGLVSAEAQKAFDLETPVIAAELNMDALVGGYPPRSLAHPLPSFPHIDRDLSLIVDEGTRWASIAGMVGELGLERLEACSFVGTFRGQQIGDGKKSVTLRLRFRDGDRTLRHEEVDPQVESVVTQAKNLFGAEVRG